MGPTEVYFLDLHMFFHLRICFKVADSGRSILGDFLCLAEFEPLLLFTIEVTLPSDDIKWSKYVPLAGTTPLLFVEIGLLSSY
jgi:hypothetical protein